MNLSRTLSLAALVAGCVLSTMAAKPLVVAHRGYWNTDGSAQNSIRSLVKADSVKCYASEFDVWMTADGVIVVNHDATINGVEIQSSPAEIVLAQKLSNGETIPTLDSYLQEAIKHPDMKLVLELKTHDSTKQENECIAKILEMINKYGLEDRTDYITFSKNGFKKLIKDCPKGTDVYYLSGDYLPQQIKFLKSAGIDYSMKVMKKHPEWVDECHKLGLKVNVWTVNEPEDIQWCIDKGVDFITTNEPELAQTMIGK